MAIRDKHTEPIVRNKHITEKNDYIFKDNIKSIATTLIVDCWLPVGSEAKQILANTMSHAAEAAGMRQFETSLEGDDKIFVGVVRSIDEHIIVHIDFKSRFATIDVLSRGGSMPHWALRVLLDVLQPDLMTLTEHRRGVSY